MTEAGRHLRLGTRASALAVVQAEWVAAEIRVRAPGTAVELVRIKTSGDRIRDRPLYEVGGKGLFVKEIEEALLGGAVDLAVHSLKDLPAALAPGLALASVPRREDPRDCLVSSAAATLAALAPGARIGTGSLRRGAFLRHARPDVEVVPMRGNVDTRLTKWRTGEIDAVLLAAAGLRRLGALVPEAHPLPIEEMLPAIGQGALAIETREDGLAFAIAARMNDPATADAVRAERAFLRGMGGDCTTPIAALATVEGSDVRLEAAVASPDGRQVVRGELRGARSEAEALGLTLAEELLARGGGDILRELERPR